MKPDAQALTAPLPAAFAAALAAYADWLAVQHRRPDGIRTQVRAIARAARWWASHGIMPPAAVTYPQARAYAQHLDAVGWRGVANGQPLARTTRVNLLGALRGFYDWACRHGLAAGNPVADVDAPADTSTDAGTPLARRQALTASEVERLVAVPDVTTLHGLRDRAALELLYSSALRRSELLALLPADLYADGVVRVRRGKGGKERLVPVGARALAWVARYRAEARPRLDPRGIAIELLISPGGQPLPARQLDALLADCLAVAGIRLAGGCHLLRHTCATLMLEGGAAITDVQRMLGHVQLKTTAGYTHPTSASLRRAWEQAHPAGVLTPAAGHEPAASAPAAS